MPSYFCFDITDYWRSFIEIAIYSDDPLRAEPEWAALHPDPADVVVAVNYFGIRCGEAWRTWRERNLCVLVEDHSHDPVSGWALDSNADYVFASLRKTLPVPDGAILWSPRGLPLPASGTVGSSASSLKLAAMLWKREYLLGGSSPEAKSTYRAWQAEAEAAFAGADVSFATRLSQRYLRDGVSAEWRLRRTENTRVLLANLQENAALLRPVVSDWPKKGAPLGAVFELPSRAQRDSLRQKLQDHGVYCPVHWPATGGCDPVARDLAGRLLTIPTDQRYEARDMEKIGKIVGNIAQEMGTDSEA